MSIVAILIKAIAVGAILAFPVGPVLLFVIQKTLNGGRKAGLMAGLGSMCVDTLYTCLAMCALALVSGFVDKNKAWIFVGGGILVVCVGLNIMKKARSLHLFDGRNDSSSSACLSTSLQAMGCAFSNPGALFYALGLVTFMGLDVTEIGISVWGILPFVALGEMLYWTVVTYALTHFVNLRDRTLRIMNWWSGVVLAVIGVVLIIKGIITLL